MSITHYLNVDLEIYSKRDLQPLAKGFGRKVFVLYVGREYRKFCVKLEVAKNVKTADAAIRTFCNLIEALPKPERTLWNTATVRSFSIGIQAGTHPNPCDFTIRPKTVETVSLVGAQIVLTIYAPETVAGSNRAPSSSVSIDLPASVDRRNLKQKPLSINFEQNAPASDT